jgi:hypothetical protein
VFPKGSITSNVRAPHDSFFGGRRIGIALSIAGAPGSKFADVDAAGLMAANASLQLQAQYNHRGVAASKKCLSAAAQR